MVLPLILVVGLILVLTIVVVGPIVVLALQFLGLTNAIFSNNLVIWGLSIIGLWWLATKAGLIKKRGKKK